MPSERTPIHTVMTPSPVTVAPEDPLTVARQLMLVHGVRHLPVCEGEEVVGIISQRDVYFIEGHRDEAREPLRVADAMSAFPYVVPPGAPLEEVVAELADAKYGCAAVVVGHRVVGVFTATDAMRVLADVLRRQRIAEPRPSERQTRSAT